MIISTVGASVLSVAWYYGINKARRDNYANFYKTYDAEADFQRMKAAGVFNCVKVKIGSREESEVAGFFAFSK